LDLVRIWCQIIENCS